MFAFLGKFNYDSFLHGSCISSMIVLQPNMVLLGITKSFPKGGQYQNISNISSAPNISRAFSGIG